MDMETVTRVLQAVGAADEAIKYMGPVLTIVMASVGSYVITQLFKFPIAYLVKDPWHGYATRYFSVIVAFLFAHYLSNHLSVPMEVITACAQPILYAICQSVAARYVPWIRTSFMGGVPETLTSKQP